MPEQEEETNDFGVRLKGTAKFAVGVVASVFAPYVCAAGLLVVAPAGLATSFIGRGICQRMASRADDEETRKKWQERRKNCIGYGTATTATGILMAFPFAFGLSLIGEGLYNGISGKDNRGILPVARWFGRKASGRPLLGSPGYEKYHEKLNQPYQDVQTQEIEQTPQQIRQQNQALHSVTTKPSVSQFVEGTATFKEGRYYMQAMMTDGTKKEVQVALNNGKIEVIETERARAVPPRAALVAHGAKQPYISTMGDGLNAVGTAAKVAAAVLGR